MEMEKFSLPVFGDSPGPSPSVTPPTVPSSPRQINVRTKKSEVGLTYFRALDKREYLMIILLISHGNFML